jgi:hypothetical protein
VSGIAEEEEGIVRAVVSAGKPSEVRESPDSGVPPVRGRERGRGNHSGFTVGPPRLGRTGCLGPLIFSFFSSFFLFFYIFLIILYLLHFNPKSIQINF